LSRRGHYLLLSLLALAPACEPPQKKSAELPEVEWEDTGPVVASGPRFDDDDFTLEVQAARVCEKASPLGPNGGKQRISVPVSIKAKTKRAVPVSPLPFTLEDKEGHTYRPTLAGCAPTIEQTTLTGGQSLKGEVAFDVPPDAGKLELVFEPFLIGRKKVTARVRVP
jgi:hypothetical protein